MACYYQMTCHYKEKKGTANKTHIAASSFGTTTMPSCSSSLLRQIRREHVAEDREGGGHDEEEGAHEGLLPARAPRRHRRDDEDQDRQARRVGETLQESSNRWNATVS